MRWLVGILTALITIGLPALAQPSSLSTPGETTAGTANTVTVSASASATAAASVIAADTETKPAFDPPAMVLTPEADRLGAVHFSVRAQAPAGLTVQQVATAGGVGFEPFDEGKTYALAADSALWLHFKVADDPSDAEEWSLVLSKPFIDRAEFYFQDAEGIWRMQAAGSRVAHRQWPAASLMPQFRLLKAGQIRVSATGNNDYYVRVQKWIPLRFAASVQRTEQINVATQRNFLTVGLLLGLLGFMVIFSGALSVVYRNTAYAWYAAYASSALLAGASFSGIGAALFWPQATDWTAISTMVFVLLGMAAQLGFTRAMFITPYAGLRGAAPRVWPRVATSTLVLLLAACAVFLAVDKAGLRLALFAVSVVGGFLVIGVLVLRSLRQERRVAGLYLLSFAPMLAVVVLTQIEQLGIAALPWLPYNAPIYGLFFELPLLLVALHLHAKKGHTQAVQKSTLAQTDPLTGFVAPGLYAATLQRMWKAARASGVDLTVVYVKVLNDAFQLGDLNHSSGDKATLRCVRTLRTVAREDDVIARVDERLFALLMPGVSRSERLASKLARLVALGVMVDPDDPLLTPVKFKIVAGSLRSFSGNAQELDIAIQKVMVADLSDGPQGAGSPNYRVICFVGKKAEQPVAVSTSAV